MLRRQHGITLIELIISMALGLLMMTALTSLFASTVGVNLRNLQLSQLQHEATAAFALMAADSARAGYSAAAQQHLLNRTQASSDFQQALVISNHPDEALDSCLLFRYDANKNGLFDGSQEVFGYRLRNRQLQRRQNAVDCASNGWQSLTSADMVAVTQLRFSLTAGVDALKQLQLQLSVASANDSGLTRRLETTVVLQNGG
jgi:type II secretory pathway component PulJ